MTRRPILRARDIRDRIKLIRRLLDGMTFEQLASDPIRIAALERLLEIISEASRHIPEDWKQEMGPDIPWRRIADLGNVIRHVYQHVDIGVLWDICRFDLDPLDKAVEAMIIRHGVE